MIHILGSFNRWLLMAALIVAAPLTLACSHLASREPSSKSKGADQVTDCSDLLYNFSMHQKLPTELKNRRLIGLGETSHGSGGLHKVAGVLILKMIEELNIRTILFEAPSSAVSKVNDLIIRGKEVPPSALSDLYFNWRSAENLELFNALSKLNRSLKEKVEIVGFDIRQPSEELKKIREFLNALDSSKSHLLKDFPVKEASASSFSKFEADILGKRSKIDDTTFQSINTNLDEISKLATDEELILSTKKIKAWLKTYWLLQNKYDEGFIERDKGMAAVVNHYVTKHGKRLPIVVWAHFGHLAFNNRSIKSDESFFAAGELLGSQLHTTFKDKYSLIALMAKRTGVATSDGKNTIFKATSDSLESRGPDSKEIVFLGPDDLRKEKKIIIGSTSDDKNPLKSSYLKMTMDSLSQFDYAAIVGDSSPLKDVTK